MLRYLGVNEWIVSAIKAMYEDASTKVRMNGRERVGLSVLRLRCIKARFLAHCSTAIYHLTGDFV